MKMKAITGSLILATVIGGAVIGSVNAQVITLGVQTAGFNGGALTTIASGPATTAVGVLGLSAGNFNVVSGSGYGEANTAGGFGSIVQAGVKFTQSSPSVLNVYYTEQNLVGTSEFGVVNGLTANGLSPGWKVTETIYFDPTNGLFDTSVADLVSTQTFTAASAAATNFKTTWSGASPYAVTEYYQITSPGGAQSVGYALASETVAAVPEASTWAMLLAGFAGLAHLIHNGFV
jgi:hypothetical protein